MQLLVLVLNKTECLDEILKELSENELHGATILDSKGMAHCLDHFNELNFMLSLRKVLNPDHKESKTIFMVIKDDEIEKVSRIVNFVTGGLDQPDTGILFTLPVNHLEGFKLK